MFERYALRLFVHSCQKGKETPEEPCKRLLLFPQNRLSIKNSQSTHSAGSSMATNSRLRAKVAAFPASIFDFFFSSE